MTNLNNELNSTQRDQSVRPKNTNQSFISNNSKNQSPTKSVNRTSPQKNSINHDDM